MAGKKKFPAAKKAAGNAAKPSAPKPGIDPITRIEALLVSRKKWLMAGIFLLSVAVNTTYYQQAKDSPLQSMHRWDNSDMAFFDQSARYIAAGHWLCDTVLHPYHEWHDEYAKLYFAQYPETAAPFYARNANATGLADTLAARRDYINEMFQGKVYHQEPLCVYLLALTYRIFGADPFWVYIWQLLLIACTNVLVFLVGRRYFGSLTGLLAALAVMVSGPILVFGMTILRTTLTAFLTLLLVFLYQRLLDRSSRGNQLAFGAVSGIALLCQSYTLLFLMPALAWYAWLNRRDLKSCAGSIGLMLGALLLVLAPLFIRNIKVGAPMASMASNGAITYILFNSSNAAPLEPSYMHFPSTVQLMHDSGGKLLPAAIACLGSFESMGKMLKLYGQKIDGLFMWFEVPNNMSYYMYREFSPLLKALPAPYWLIAPLGICGLFFAFWRYKWKFIPLFLMILVSASPMFISSSLARYRTPFVILMTLLAVFFVLEIAKSLLTAKWKALLSGAALFALAWYYTDNIRDKKFVPFFANDILPAYILHYKDRLIELEKEQKLVEYQALTTEVVEYLPDYFFELKSGHRAIYSNEAQCCRMVANLIKMHASILEANGNKAESAKFNERINILTGIADDFSKRTGKGI
jgi:4-amino-4-deoxy-L-arabinose transferase-like glycosyltransferase